MGNRILWLALVGSVALHAVLLLWSRPPPPEPPPHTPSGTVVFVEVAAEPPVPDPPGPGPARPPPARPLPPAPRQVSPEPPPRVEAPRPPPGDDAPRAAPRLTLMADRPVLLATDGGLPPAGTLRAALTAPRDLVGALARETLGRGRVDRGLVHPYYSQLGKALLKHWDADRAAKGGLKGYAEQLGQNFKAFNSIWQERAAAYGRSGSPLDPGEAPHTGGRQAPANERIQGLPGVDLEARKELGRQMAAQFRATRRATLRVVQDREGRLLLVELVEPSSDEAVDREALKDVQAAAEKLPPPPPEALEGKATLSSLWTFELIVSISPPVPTFSFEFDEALGFIDARLPLDRRLYKQVRLVSVE